MQTTRKELLKIRSRFELEIEKAKLSASTAKRYRSWAKRFILHCKYSGVELEKESAKYFLRSYPSLNTRRQGYYALKFFFKKVIRQRYFAFTGLFEVRPQKKRRAKVWRRWW